MAGHPAGGALRRSQEPGDLFIVGCGGGPVIGRPPYLRRSSSGLGPETIGRDGIKLSVDQTGERCSVSSSAPVTASAPMSLNRIV